MMRNLLIFLELIIQYFLRFVIHIYSSLFKKEELWLDQLPEVVIIQILKNLHSSNYPNLRRTSHKLESFLNSQYFFKRQTLKDNECRVYTIHCRSDGLGRNSPQMDTNKNWVGTWRCTHFQTPNIPWVRTAPYGEPDGLIWSLKVNIISLFAIYIFHSNFIYWGFAFKTIKVFWSIRSLL